MVYSNHNVVDTSDMCFNAFLVKFSPMGKTNALRNKTLVFNN
jgi:hypothetical protein